MKKRRKQARQTRTRKKILQTAKSKGFPRLSVFRSNKYLYAQIIDDKKGKTLVSVFEKELEGKKDQEKTSTEENLGKLLAQKAKEKKIVAVIFDRGRYKYHGRIKTFAQACREGGLRF